MKKNSKHLEQSVLSLPIGENPMSEHLEFERKSPRKIGSIEILRRYRQYQTIINASEFLTKIKMVEEDFDVFGTKGKLISTLYLCELSYVVGSFLRGGILVLTSQCSKGSISAATKT